MIIDVKGIGKFDFFVIPILRMVVDAGSVYATVVYTKHTSISP
jgi:hypothetical protein